MGFVMTAFLVIAKIYAFQTAPHIFYSSADPDITLRFTIVRDLLQGHGWQNHTIDRMNWPYGVETPWTRIVDILLIFCSLPFFALLPLDNALLAGGMLYSPLLGLACIGMICAIAHRMGDVPFTYFLIPLLFLFSPPILSYFAPGNVDHHSLLTTLAVCALYFSVRLSEHEKFSIFLGLTIGAGIWVSVEFQLFALAVFGWIGWMWCLSGERRWMRHLYVSGFCASLLSLAGLISEHPLAHLMTIEYDSLSIVHVVTLGGIGLAGLLLGSLKTRKLLTRSGRFILSCAVALALFALLGWFFPLFYLGPMANVDPRMKTEFLPYIVEMQPILEGEKGFAIGTLSMAVIELGLLWYFRREHSLSAYFWLLAITSLFFLALSFNSLRLSYYFIPCCLLMIIYLLGKWEKKEHYPRLLRKEIGIVLLALLPSYSGMIAAKAEMIWKERAAVVSPAEKVKQADDKKRTQCHQDFAVIMENGKFAKALGPARTTILAHSNIGTYILWRTPYAIYSSNYHRDYHGYLDMQEVLEWRDADKARSILKERETGVLVLCDLQKSEGGGLYRYLKTAEPSWAKPLPQLTPKGSPLRIYRVDFNGIVLMAGLDSMINQQ